MKRVLLMTVVVIMAGVLVGPLRADEPSGDLATRWKVDDANPGANIPSVEERNQDPLEFAYFLQDLLARGQNALTNENWPDAVKYFEALGHAVPDSRLAFDRLCLAYGRLGKHAHAAGNCARAAALPGAKINDHLRLIEHSLQSERFGSIDVQNIEASLQHLRAHLAKNPHGEPDEGAAAPAPPPERKKTKEELLAYIRHLAERPRGGKSVAKQARGTQRPQHLPSQVEFLNCKFAVKLGDGQRLASCIDELRRMKVDERQLTGLSWSHALLTRDEGKANALLASVQTLGLPADTLNSMRAEQARVFGGRFSSWIWIVIVAAALAAIAASTIVVRRRLTSSRSAA